MRLRWPIWSTRSGRASVSLRQQYLVVVPVALLLFLFGLIVYCLMLRGRPLKTRGSSYPLVGHIKFWFVAILVLALMAIAAARPYLVSGVSSFQTRRHRRRRCSGCVGVDVG